MSNNGTATKSRTASVADRQARYVNEYRNATHGVESSKHAANVNAVAYFKTLDTTVTVTTAKSKKDKPVGAIDRARQTIEALSVKVERDASGKVKKGDDAMAYTPQRLVQIVEAFDNAERAGVVKVATLATKGAKKPDPEQVEALVSAFDQARVLGGTKAAQALASQIREGGADSVEVAAAEVASQVADLRQAKKEQTKEAPKPKPAATIVGDAVQALVSVLEAEAQNLDAGQKSALLAKIEAATLFLK